MTTQTSQHLKIEQSLQGSQTFLPLTFCLIVLCVSISSSSIAQSVEAASRSVGTARQSIISLAPSPQLAAETVARRVTDSTFENPPANYRVFPAAKVGEITGSEVLTLNFAGQTTLTRIQSTNKDFVLEPGGTCMAGVRYSRGESCALIVHFSPQGPGHRLGFIQIAHSADSATANIGLTGNGYAPVVSFTPSQITTVPATVSSGVGVIAGATSMAVDGGDILYIADTGNDKVTLMDSSGNLTTTALSPIAVPASLAVDSFGIIYTTNLKGSTYYFSIYYPWGSQTAYGYAYAAATCTVSAPCAFSAVGMSSPAYMSIDNYNDLFFEEGTTGAAEMPVGSISGGSGALNLWHLSDQFAYSSGSPSSFAVDANGNLYTAYNFSSSTCFLVMEPLYNAEYSPTAKRVAGGAACGFSGDGGQATGAEISNSIGQMDFDIAGNLYFADAGNQRVRRIDAATGIIRTIAGNGTAGYSGDNGPATLATLRSPAGIGVDSQGQVYILSNSSSTGTAQVVRKVGTNGLLSFPSTATGATSITLQLNLANTGNSALTFLRESIGGTNRTEFSIDSDTTTCNFATGGVLAAGQTCQIGLIFKPTAVGSRSATLTLLDNTVTGSNKVTLRGTAVAPVNVSFTAPTSSLVTPGAKTPVTVTVSSSGSTPTGKVKFTIDGKAAGTPTLISGTASVVLAALPAGTHQLVASYSGDKQHATGKATMTLTVN